MSSFEEIIEELKRQFPKDKYPEMFKKLSSLQFKFLHTQRRMEEAEREMDKLSYKLGKAEEKLGVEIPDKTANIILKIHADKMKGYVERVDISENEKGLQELLANVIGKEENSGELDYFIEQLQRKAYTVNIEVLRNGNEKKEDKKGDENSV